MAEFGTISESSGVYPAIERRASQRYPVGGMLWMVDHDGCTILPCQCIEASAHGMRLRVPLGYGVAEGQRYELRSHLPGTAPRVAGFSLVGSRWATVVRTQLRLEEDANHIEVGVAFDAVESTALQVIENPVGAV
jgi:hypothetical protein